MPLPAAPARVTRSGFPLLATLAPVVLSLALFAITRSPFALLFAVLGPVVALASLGDSARHGRRARRRDRAEFLAECDSARRLILERQDLERRRLDAAFPPLRRLLEHPTDLWTVSASSTLLMIGRGEGPSGVQVDRPARTRSAGRAAAQLKSLSDLASRMDDRAIVVDAVAGVAFAGATAAESAARAAVLHLAATLPPDRWSVTVSTAGGADWSWIDGLPHRTDLLESVSDTTLIDFAETAAPTGARDVTTGAARVVVIPSSGRAPRGLLHRVEVETGASRLSSSGDPPSTIRGEFATAEEAGQIARGLRRAAREAGVLPAAGELPRSVDFRVLPPDVGRPGTLACPLGLDPDGVWTIDLVRDGPHAVIGGTTGSGKSELLATWMLSLARSYRPEEVNLLLVDFKGGATFGPFTALPHSVGLITDLDDRQARRALESLRAELLFRERRLADAAVRSIELLPETAALPRLVIVVDEFAAVTGDLPDLHRLFVDLAARGRSLGVHLVLCTQRPAGALREAILANCTLRISLRVNDAADSLALIGVPDASALPRHSAGRALVSIGGEAPTLVQVAIASAADVEAASSGPSAPVRRPWCDPLPTRLTGAELERRAPRRGDVVPFGLLDLPALQRQEAATWDPPAHGHVLVSGAFASGRSTAVRALAASRHAVVLPGDIEAVWDTVTASLHDIRRGARTDRVLAIDDVDALVARLGPEHRLELVDALVAVLREGPSAGVFAILSVRGVTSALHSLAAACDSRLILRASDRAEHVVSGGRSLDFDERMQAGGGFWRGDRVQVLAVPATPRPLTAQPAPAAAPLVFPLGGVTAVVTPAPAAFRERIARFPSVRVVELGISPPAATVAVAGAREHVALVGDPDAWQAAWSLLPAIRARGGLLFYRASLADYRAVTRSRELPPPLGTPDEQVWVLGSDGSPVRAALT